jgi:glycosyltransferase 2 family protein
MHRMCQMRHRRFQLFGVGLAFSVIFLYLALRGLDWHALGNTLLGVQMGPLTLSAGMIAIGILVRGWRWRLIAGRGVQEGLSFARATNLGILGNQLLPARLGEVVRIVALQRILKTGLSESVGSALIDRIFDTLVLFASAWVVSTVMVREFLPQSWLLGLGAALALLGMGLLVACNHRFHAWLTAWSERYLHRWSLRPDSFLRVLYGIVGRLTCWRAGSSVVALALLVWLADYLAVLAALWSIGLVLSWEAPLLLWVMLAAGSTLPSTPGYVGVYQLAAVLALAAYDIPAHLAIAVAIILQAMTLLVSLVGAGGELRLLWSRAVRDPDDQDV